MTNSVEKTVEMKASVDRVWDALTDHRQFGEWFRVKLDRPFAVGEISRGHITHPGFEHLAWEATITRIDKPYAFAFTWHPYAIDPGKDYSGETPTLVEFRLESISGGSRLTITETGFDALPAHRWPDALRMNERGWVEQMKNIKTHVGG